jgi:hypothetical protein
MQSTNNIPCQFQEAVAIKPRVVATQHCNQWRRYLCQFGTICVCRYNRADHGTYTECCAMC